MDTVTSTFFPVLTRIDDDIDEIERSVVAEPTEAVLQRIFSIKRGLVDMRRVISPERDMFARNAERISNIRGLESLDRTSRS
jgi:magnesium transporter